ncbi:MAG: B12-binding domain-containing radical SAM protein [Elusimicrobiales bacterium]|nr:B12-binding domain-containing radical SAM protein [Elusimicrobiales bacterium]
MTRTATDLLLISPHQPRSAEILRESTGITQPLGLGYIAAYARARGLSAAILDNDIEDLDDEAFMRRVRAAAPLCAGFSVCTSSHNTALHLARLVKKVDPGIQVIFGGVQPSTLPRLLMKETAVDFAVQGEGEVTAAELVLALKAGAAPSSVAGLFYKKDGAAVFTGERPLIEDLDSLPFPAYDLMPMGRYTLPASRRMTSAPAASIVTSRGCPYGCYFCSHNGIFRGKVRFRSARNVLDEMKLLVRDYGVGEFLVWDDSFLMRGDRALELCRLIKEELPGITWSCSSRADHMTPALAAALRAAGCRLVLFGVESGSEKILASINKGTRPEQVRAAVKACRENGLMSFCSFVIGTPDETEETVRETRRFAMELNPDFVIFCIFAPLPGSHFFSEFVKDSRLDPDRIDWDSYINLMSSRPPLVAAGNLSKERLTQLQKELFRAFYFRPSYVWRRLKLLRSPQQFYQNLRGLKTLIKLQLQKFK